MQRILNCRAGTLAHLPDYGLPDMTKILQGMPGTAHQLITILSAVLLKYEPRLSRINVVMQEQIQPGELRYAIDAELKGVGLVRYGTEFMPEGRVLIRHLKQQQYLDNTARLLANFEIQHVKPPHIFYRHREDAYCRVSPAKITTS